MPNQYLVPSYHTHELELDFSGSLKTPGTIDLLGSSFERWDSYAGGDLYKRYATSGLAASVVVGAVPEASTWVMMILGSARLALLDTRAWINEQSPDFRAKTRANRAASGGSSFSDANARQDTLPIGKHSQSRN